MIEKVAANSASRSGLARGQVILQVNKVLVASAEGFAARSSNRVRRRGAVLHVHAERRRRLRDPQDAVTHREEFVQPVPACPSSGTRSIRARPHSPSESRRHASSTSSIS